LSETLSPLGFFKKGACWIWTPKRGEKTTDHKRRVHTVQWGKRNESDRTGPSKKGKIRVGLIRTETSQLFFQKSEIKRSYSIEQKGGLHDHLSEGKAEEKRGPVHVGSMELGGGKSSGKLCSMRKARTRSWHLHLPEIPRKFLANYKQKTRPRDTGRTLNPAKKSFGRTETVGSATHKGKDIVRRVS